MVLCISDESDMIANEGPMSVVVDLPKMLGISHLSELR